MIYVVIYIAIYSLPHISIYFAICRSSRSLPIQADQPTRSTGNWASADRGDRAESRWMYTALLHLLLLCCAGVIGPQAIGSPGFCVHLREVGEHWLLPSLLGCDEQARGCAGVQGRPRHEVAPPCANARDAATLCRRGATWKKKNGSAWGPCAATRQPQLHRHTRAAHYSACPRSRTGHQARGTRAAAPECSNCRSCSGALLSSCCSSERCVSRPGQ